MVVTSLMTVLATLAIQPSFDCARASSASEREICGSPRLSTLDRRLAEAYANARQRLPAGARESLRQDQTWFLGVRDEAFESRGEPWLIGFPDMAERIQQRAAFLNSIEPTRTGMDGRWANLAGSVEIRPMSGGRYLLDFSAAHPLNGRWICQTEVVAREDDGVLSGQSVIDPNMRISVTWADGILTVSETRVDGEPGGAGYCGMNGFISGPYFPVRAG